MALPDNKASSEPVLAEYVSPYDRYKAPLEDFEEGPVALNDASQGLDNQVWRVIYNDDEGSAGYGNFTVVGETTNETVVALNASIVTNVGLAFNQNGDVFLCYENRNCEAKYYYYDTVAADYLTATLPAGSHSVACCLDDHRSSQVGTSDTILAYIRAGTLYYRQERDRFTVERSLGLVGAAVLARVGMTKNLRLLFDVREGPGQRLSEIVGDLCRLVRVPAYRIDVTALYPIWIRGYKSAQMYNAADSIRALMELYFFDFPRIDGQLVAVLRGGEVSATITQNDLVAGREFKFESAREQGLEFPVKLHLGFANAETDYTPTKVTAEIRSRDWQSKSEDMRESAVNHTEQDAQDRVDILQKQMLAAFEGWAKFSIPETFAKRVPSSLIYFEVRAGVFRVMRITVMTRDGGYFDCEAVIDRGSAYTSGTIAPPVLVPPEPPPPTIPGDTTWEFMDVPVLDGVSDSLYYMTAGRGEPNTAWHGYRLQRLVGSDWETETDVVSAELMGTLQEALAYGSGDFIDTVNTILLELSGTPASVTTDLMLQHRGAWLLISDSTFEIIQVRDWTAEGDYWRGSYLFRGRLDTAATAHAGGTRAVFLNNPYPVPTDSALRDTLLTLRAPSFGQVGSDAAEDDYLFIGRSQEEWPPMLLEAEQSGADWVLAWTPRWRLGSSASPMPSANFYGWRLRFTVGPTTAVRDTLGTAAAFLYTEADQIVDFGSAQGSFDAVEIRALNYLGGEGKALTEAVS